MYRMWWRNQATKQWENRVLQNQTISGIELACERQLKSFVTDVSSGVVLERTLPSFKDASTIKYWAIYRPGGKYHLKDDLVPAQILLYTLLEGST